VAGSEKERDPLLQELAAMRQHIEELEESEAKLRASQEALRRSEERYRLLVENARELIVVAQDGRIKYANPRVAEFSGYSLDDLALRPFADMIHPDDREMVLERHQKRLRGEEIPPVYSFRIIDKEGRTRWLEISAVRIQWEGRPATLNFLTDITERKRAEEALLQARNLLSALIQSSPLAITAWDPDERIWMWNAAAERLFGWKEDEVRGLSRPIIPDHQADQFRAHLHRALWGDVFSGVELQCRKRDGSIVETSFSAAPLHDDKGLIIGAMGIFSDISERLRAERALKHSEERYRLLAENMSDVVWTMDVDLRFTYMSPSVKNLLGYNVGEAMAKGIPGIFTPESAELLLKTLGEGLEQLGPRGRLHPVTLVLELICADGSTKWTESVITFVQDSHSRSVTIQGATRDISERRKAEEDLREGREKYRLLVENQNELIVKMDREGRLLYASPSYCQLLGKSEEELLGGPFVPLVHPEDQASIVQAIGNLSHPPYSSFVEIRSITPAGMRWLAWSHRSILDKNEEVIAIVGVGRDITERKMAEEALWESEVRYRSVVEQSPDGIFLLDVEGKTIVEANAAFKAMMGYTSEELEGLSLYGLVAASKKEIDETLQQVLAAGGITGLERQYRRKNGTLVDVWINARLISYGGKKFICSVVRDVTEKKALEAHRLRAQRMESIGQLAGGIAHDLNNILGPIMINVELLQMKHRDRESQKILSSIASCAQRGADFVRQILDFSRGVEGQHQIIPPKYLLKEMEQMAREAFPKSIQVESELPKDLWCISGDPTQLHQVLLNLCVNARDAMPQGGKLTLSAENVHVDEIYATMQGDPQIRPGPYVVLSVADTGTGIPPEIKERIFDPFFTTKERTKGTGLGLSTVQTIVKSHRGFLSVYSELGQGSVFKVYLPAALSQAEEAEEESRALPCGKGDLILLVEDEDELRGATEELLRNCGYRVLAAADGSEAVSLYARYQGEIRVVLTDMGMPVMDGLATIRGIQKMDPEARFIATSGLDHDQALAKSCGAGVKAFLPKPFSARKLLALLREVVGG